LQKVHGFDARSAGLALCAMFFASAIGNPLFGRLSDSGRGRWTAVVLLLAALLMAVFPHVPANWTFPVLAAWGFFFLASYPMIEALLMESVPDGVRGRIYGMFITVGGLVGQLSHWIMGEQVKRMGEGAHAAASYHTIYYALAGMVLLTLLGLPCLKNIRKKENVDALPAPHDPHPIPLQ
jgi:MFS family permease